MRHTGVIKNNYHKTIPHVALISNFPVENTNNMKEAES